MTEPPSILECMEHPDMFGPSFKGPSWAAWKVFLRSLFALQMSEADLAVYREHTGRVAPPTEPLKEAELVVGRRGGKSRILALIAVYLAIFRPVEEYLAPGEVATVAIIAADRKQARSIFRYTIGLLKSVPSVASLVQDSTADTITLSNRIVLEIQTASFRATRGYSFLAVLADETGFWRDDTGANPDVEIFRALRPGMSSIPTAILLNASSPYRRAGLLWQTFQRHYGKENSRVLVWKAPTAAMNPCIYPATIAEAYEEDPESAASEYGAEFRSDISDFISRAVVEACVEPGCHERPPLRAAGRRYSMFIDASGGSGSDSMTCAIGHLEPDGNMPTLDAVRERRPPFSPDDVVNEFSDLARSYGVAVAESDKWGGDWPGESFRKNGLRVVPSAKPKSDLYLELLPMLNAHRCNLLDHPRLVSQLCALERRTARGGRDSIDHPPGPTAHDDVANAVAGLLVNVKGRQPMKISPEALEKMRHPVPGTYGWQRMVRGY